MPTLEEARRFQADCVVADLHAHPALKTDLVRCKFWERHAANRGFAPTKLRTNLPSVDTGGVNLLFSSMYVPEKKLRDDCWLIRPASCFTPGLARAQRETADFLRLAQALLETFTVKQVRKLIGGNALRASARRTTEPLNSGSKPAAGIPSRSSPGCS